MPEPSLDTESPSEENTSASTLRVQEILADSSSSKVLSAMRDGYEQRLKTFSPATYFAKPASLSPLVCARLGFQTMRPNFLECTSCKAVLKIDIHRCLSQTARTSLTCKFEDELAAVHKESCPFRHDAESYIRERNKGLGEDLVPTLLAQVLPAETMDLLDPPRPWKGVKRMWKEQLTKRRFSSEWSIPTCLEKFQSNEEGSDLLTRLLKRVKSPSESSTDSSSEEQPNETDEKLAMALVLMGWSPCFEGDLQECSICKACLREPLPVSQGTAEPFTKRPRPSTGLRESHRHYCPFVCGFPWRGSTRATPLYESLLLRLLQKENDPREETTPADAYVKVRGMLQSSLSPSVQRKRQLDSVYL